MNVQTGEIVAVKQIPLFDGQLARDRSRVKALEQEINFLRSMSHINVVRYIGAQIEPDEDNPMLFNLNIILEYVPGGSIASLLETFGRFSLPMVKVYTKQLLIGLCFLHRHGIVHRDIKGGNVLVDPSGQCKLADFGASAKVADFFSQENHSIKGTPYWMAPEVIRQGVCTPKVDVWGVGCTVIEMSTGKPPWNESTTLLQVLLTIGMYRFPIQILRVCCAALLAFLF